MPEICPFLAASHDPDSVLNYPSAANVCTKLGEPQPVANEHQAGYCLRARHWFCPVYTGAIKQPPIPIQFKADTDVTESRAPRESREARLRQYRRIRERRLLLGLLIAVLAGSILCGGARFLGGQSQSGPTLITMNATISEAVTASAISAKSATLTITPAEVATALPTITATISDTSTSSLTPTPGATVIPIVATTEPTMASPTSSVTNTSTPTPSITPTSKACEIPFGWQHYTVSAGETYFRIAVKFGTTVDALQRVNCLVAPERLLAGQVINVPPTATPSK